MASSSQVRGRRPSHRLEVYGMARRTIGLALRDRLGEQATRELDEHLDHETEAWRKDVMTACTERVDMRLERFALKEDLVNGLAGLRQDMANLRTELLRWTFAFWIGQVLVSVALATLLFQSLSR